MEGNTDLLNLRVQEKEEWISKERKPFNKIFMTKMNGRKKKRVTLHCYLNSFALFTFSKKFIFTHNLGPWKIYYVGWC